MHRSERGVLNCIEFCYVHEPSNRKASLEGGGDDKELGCVRNHAFKLIL